MFQTKYCRECGKPISYHLYIGANVPASPICDQCNPSLTRHDLPPIRNISRAVATADLWRTTQCVTGWHTPNRSQLQHTLGARIAGIIGDLTTADIGELAHIIILAHDIGRNSEGEDNEQH